jgi:hypothetical protein
MALLFFVDSMFGRKWAADGANEQTAGFGGSTASLLI